MSVFNLLILLFLITGCTAAPSVPTPEDLTGEHEIETLYNVSPLQHEIISDAIADRLKSDSQTCDKRFHIVDQGEYEEGERFSVSACKQRFEVVFDLSQDKVISINRLDESRPDGP